MTVIVINGPSDGALINYVHLWTLKYVDNSSSFFKVPHKALIGIQHDKRISIINASGNSISVKFSLVTMATGVGCTIHASDAQWATGG